MSRWPRRISLVGGLFVVFAAGQTTLTIASGGAILGASVDFVLTAFPGVLLLYLGSWLPNSGLDPELYPRVLMWCLGGIVVMYGFITLRVLHPNVSVEFTPGTRSIAIALGSVGGIAIGLSEARAITHGRALSERNEQLKQRERELERQNERLDEFTSIVAHDFRNPLSVARGRLELAREECESEHLSLVADSHERMETLIDDILLMARQDESVTEVELVDIAGIATESWQTAETGDADLRVETDRAIRADESMLKQLLENLFRNAVEHGGDDVTVTVGALNDPDGFYLEDDGPGIPEGMREDVFDYGFSSSDDGTGFGLAIVERMCDAHGWNVEPTEGESGGARFEVTGVELGQETDDRATVAPSAE
ncbi:ATP-binding protein [Halorussus salilacus]|uniref:ATP-binding protein n=1 Tax=Halorussus salilacus TaxID=2953750 RepID=UPI0020A1D4EF|nr:ATP-binding protein [Halorussus salilacus]USZ67992.1 ATP-binding protein [Halorussus salilacus]